MLPDAFFTWPYPGDGLDEAISDLKSLFLKSLLSPYVDNMFTGDIVAHVALECRNRNVSPWWLVTSGEREQSAFSKVPVTADLALRALQAWLGVVGQDVGRTSLPGYYGAYTQVTRFCEVTDWLLGVESALAWPEYYRTRKTAPRYQLGKTLPVKGMDGLQVVYQPLSRGDYLQLAYTPHLKVLQVNEELARKYTPTKFL